MGRGRKTPPERRNWNPQNPDKLTDAEVLYYLALSDEEEHIGGGVHSDISVECSDEEYTPICSLSRAGERSSNSPPPVASSHTSPPRTTSPQPSTSGIISGRLPSASLVEYSDSSDSDSPPTPSQRSTETTSRTSWRVTIAIRSIPARFSRVSPLNYAKNVQVLC